MGVGHHLVDLVLLAVVAAPHLAVAHKEQLLGGQLEILNGKTVLIVAAIVKVSFVSRFQTAIVCNVLSKCSPTQTICNLEIQMCIKIMTKCDLQSRKLTSF